jgi:Sigma-70 region 2
VDPSHYTEYRPLMFSIAYRMTGSVSDAEDIVQEAFLRVGKDGKDAVVESLKAYLARAGPGSRRPGPRGRSSPACSWPRPAAAT